MGARFRAGPHFFLSEKRRTKTPREIDEAASTGDAASSHPEKRYVVRKNGSVLWELSDVSLVRGAGNGSGPAEFPDLFMLMMLGGGEPTAEDFEELYPETGSR